MVHSTKTKLETKKILDIGKYRLRARAGWYCVLIGESNVAIDPAIGGYGVAIFIFSCNCEYYGLDRVQGHTRVGLGPGCWSP